MNGERVVVIGGSSGIGFEVARQAVERGASLTIVGRDQDRLAAAAAAIGGRVDTIGADAHDDGAVEKIFTTIEPVRPHSLDGRRLDGGRVPHNVGRYHAPRSPLEVLGELDDRSVRSSENPAGWEHHLHVGHGGRPQDISASYVANQGIAALVQGLASELAPNVRVNAVAATFMGRQTAFWKHVPSEELAAAEASFLPTVPLGRLATVQEVATARRNLTCADSWRSRVPSATFVFADFVIVANRSENDTLRDILDL